MVKHISQTRERYEKYYRNIRKGSGLVAEALGLIYDNETFDCAILSFDMQSSVFVGWTNYGNMLKFNRLRPTSPAKYRFPF